MPYQSDGYGRRRSTQAAGSSRHAARFESGTGSHARSPYSGGRHEGGYSQDPYDQDGRVQGRHVRRSSAQASCHAASTSTRTNPYGSHAAVRSVSRGDDRQRRLERARAIRRAQQRRARIIGVAAVVLLVALVVAGSSLLRGKSSGGSDPSPSGSSAVTNDVPAPSESELRIEEVRARASANCTREQPTDLTDPADYAALGKATMEGILANAASWDGFDNIDLLSLDARTNWDGEAVPYLLAVNRAANVVTVYALDADNRYTVPYMSMICSTGTATPIGYYLTDDKYSWQPLFQEVYGQYATHIVNDILFHSVPYYNPYKDDVEYAEFNKLGTAASLGCVRLQACDIKWIYDNCPLGTPVVLYDDATSPGPMGRPGTIATNETDTDTASATYRGFDPTDPDDANPWDDAYRSGTAIRSDAAQAEWDAAQADGRWSGTITPTDLLGYSTNAESRG